MAHKCSDELKMELTGEVVHFIPGGSVTDTNDATATPDHIQEGMTAYAGGKRITGRLPVTSKLSAEFDNLRGTPLAAYIGGTATEKTIVNEGAAINMIVSAKEFGDAAPNEVEKGKLFSSKSGVLVEGSLPVFEIMLTPADQVSGSEKNVSMKISMKEKSILKDGAEITVSAPLSEFGDAMGDNVAAGTLFTSAAGFQAEGKLPVTDKISAAFGSLRYTPMSFVLAATNEAKSIVNEGAAVGVFIPASEFGDATENDVAAGKFFTSASGLKLIGKGSYGAGSGSISAVGDGDSIVITTTAAVNAEGDNIIIGG